MSHEQSVILVTGATGHVGRHVVSELQRTGARVRALTRNPDSAGLQGGVDVVRADLSVPDTLDACLNGVEAVFLVWPFLPAGFAPAVLDAVTKHARRIVFLSALTVRDDLEQQIDPITAFHANIERLIEQSGLEWTFLRCSGFATNALLWTPQIRSEGVVRWPYGAAARSLIHERDIAAIAVRALTGDWHGRAKYILTGPQSLAHAEQVHIIGEAIGRPLRYEEISPKAARQQMLTEGWPPSFVDGALNYWAKLVAEPELITPTVEEITGAPARTFREWAIDHAGDFRPRNQFTGLRVAITGGTSGLGLALVRELLDRGAQVAFVARRREGVERVVREHPGVHGIVGDVSKKDDIHPIVIQIVGSLGGLDVLVNNASDLGPAPLALLADTECEDLERALATNVLGPFRLTKALLGALASSAREGRGAVVLNVSSDAAINPYPRWGAYGASKAALHHLSRIWNAELEAEGIRFLSIDPGDMDTPLHALAAPDADRSELKRPATAARELADAIGKLLPRRGMHSQQTVKETLYDSRQSASPACPAGEAVGR